MGKFTRMANTMSGENSSEIMVYRGGEGEEEQGSEYFNTARQEITIAVFGGTKPGEVEALDLKNNKARLKLSIQDAIMFRDILEDMIRSSINYVPYNYER